MSFNWLSRKARTGGNSVSGRGTFAKERIRKGELIAAFGGYAMDNASWKTLPGSVRWHGIRIHDGLVIGARKKDELGDGDFVNHSCDPNSGIRGQIILVAMRDIRKGEEITFDYATVLHGTHFRMPCACGSSKCRKAVSSEDWKRPEIRKKYDGYFSLYLQEKIDKKRKG